MVSAVALSSWSYAAPRIESSSAPEWTNSSGAAAGPFRGLAVYGTISATNELMATMREPPEPAAPGAFHPRGKNPGDFWRIAAETRSLGAIMGERGAVKVPGGAGWVGHPPGGEARIIREQDPRWLSPGGRNPGDCWEISTRPCPGAHFAVFPEHLVETPIKAGCPLEVCIRCGMAKEKVHRLPENPGAFNIRVRDVQAGRLKAADRRASETELRDYDEHTYRSRARGLVISPGCGCRAGFRRAIVLDPFMGSGTTAVVARKLGRDFIGFELNPRYVRMARNRLAVLGAASHHTSAA